MRIAINSRGFDRIPFSSLGENPQPVGAGNGRLTAFRYLSSIGQGETVMAQDQPHPFIQGEIMKFYGNLLVERPGAHNGQTTLTGNLGKNFSFEKFL